MSNVENRVHRFQFCRKFSGKFLSQMHTVSGEMKFLKNNLMNRTYRGIPAFTLCWDRRYRYRCHRKYPGAQPFSRTRYLSLSQVQGQRTHRVFGHRQYSGLSLSLCDTLNSKPTKFSTWESKTKIKPKPYSSTGGT